MFFDFNSVHKISPDLLRDFIGFQFELPRQSPASYPPYNMIKHDDDSIDIELAVAGFSEDELAITTAEGQLTVSGKKAEEDKSTYVHRGISGRSFERKFVLDRRVVVDGASYENGILRISLRKIVPESEKLKKIEIGKGKRQVLMEETPPLL